MGGEIEEHVGVELLRGLSHEDGELSDAVSEQGQFGLAMLIGGLFSLQGGKRQAEPAVPPLDHAQSPFRESV
jgi:hypothetical protein